MSTHSTYFSGLIDSLSARDEVEGILLAGSMVTGTNDSESDYDVYVYLNSHLPLPVRHEILENHCQYMELDNHFWETEDDGILKDGTDLEIIYRKLQDHDEVLYKHLFQEEASVGYSTCFWANLLESQILYDRNGELQKLKDKYSIEYPKQLKINIVAKNYSLLSKQMPAYYFQIRKAIKRGDLVSLNHRVAAFLASYFDIIFAINEVPHPGEKMLLDKVKKLCKKVPDQFEEGVVSLLKSIDKGENILGEIQEIVAKLDLLLEAEKLISFVQDDEKNYPKQLG